MYWIIKHKPTEKYYGCRRVFVSSSCLAHRFYTIRQARRYIAENNLIRGDYTITEVKYDEIAVHEQKSAKRLTERLFNQIYRMNRE